MVRSSRATTLGRAGLMEEGQQFLLALFPVDKPDLLGIGEG